MKPSKQRKLAKKRRRERQRRLQRPVSQAYHGNKYKKDELVPIHFQTETGIYEAFVISNRTITDHHVRKTLERLIDDVRVGRWRRLAADDSADPPLPPDGECGLLDWNIRKHWEDFFERTPYPGNETLVGILRTILGSIEVWGNINPASRGYLHYLEGFMGKLGVHCRKVSQAEARELLGEDFPADLDADDEYDKEADDEYDEEADDDEDELLLAGREWAAGEESAGVVFKALAEEMLREGKNVELACACRYALSFNPPEHVRAELAALMPQAQGEPTAAPPPRRTSFFSRLLGR